MTIDAITQEHLLNLWVWILSCFWGFALFGKWGGKWGHEKQGDRKENAMAS